MDQVYLVRECHQVDPKDNSNRPMFINYSSNLYRWARLTLEKKRIRSVFIAFNRFLSTYWCTFFSFSSSWSIRSYSEKNYHQFNIRLILPLGPCIPTTPLENKWSIFILKISGMRKGPYRWSWRSNTKQGCVK